MTKTLRILSTTARESVLQERMVRENGSFGPVGEQKCSHIKRGV